MRLKKVYTRIYFYWKRKLRETENERYQIQAHGHARAPPRLTLCIAPFTSLSLSLFKSFAIELLKVRRTFWRASVYVSVEGGGGRGRRRTVCKGVVIVASKLRNGHQSAGVFSGSLSLLVCTQIYKRLFISILDVTSHALPMACSSSSLLESERESQILTSFHARLNEHFCTF